MEFIMYVVDIFLHLDVHLNEIVVFVGPIGFYAIVCAVIFCETGLVVTPFLPGDSLLFACGALASIDGSPLHLWIMLSLFAVSAIAGDALNYTIGAKVGDKLFSSKRLSRFLNKKHLDYTHAFYEKHGGKTIILARFIPIIRTFAPFVAGIAAMTYRRFALYNVTGGVAWILLFTCGGYYLGNLEAVKRNFHIIIVAIIIISVLPAVFEFLRARREVKAQS